MSFSRVVCWNPVEAARILDTDALQVTPSVFRAVHHPVRFYRRDPLPGEEVAVPHWGQGSVYGEQDFLKDLLDPRTDYRLVSVIGRSGTGKSHLIRWMAAQIPDGSRYRVILVPRAGTNLREVIRRILAGVEGEVFDRFRDRLSRAVDPIGEDQARARLLDRLAEAIEFTDDGDEALLAGQQSSLHQHLLYCKEHAPGFLRDPHFRGRWLREGGVLDRLYDLTLGSARDVDRLDERRQFEESDLPLEIADWESAARVTQRFYRNLLPGTATDLRTALLLVLNRHLDAAIRGLLQLGTDELSKLLREVRRALASEGRELVLLIEDIARLQGIDRQLLDALLERPQSDEGKLSGLRAVVGCTDGYFGTLPNTFRTRCSFVVDLNIDPADASPTGDVLVQMSAKYLNAVRVGQDGLERWFKTPSESADLPNACSDCEHREICHAAFGQVEGKGVYPFSPFALAEMYRRTNADGLNPRFLLHDVLGRILVGYADEISSGSFPPPQLHADFGGQSNRWSPEDTRLVQRATQGAAQRYIALLDLWCDGTSLGGLAEGVLRAFGMQRPEVEDETDADQRPTPPPSTKPLTPTPSALPTPSAASLPPRTASLLQALDDWSRGGRLDQTTTNELRGKLFVAATARIPWNTERLAESLLSNRTGSAAFTQRSINFEGQATTESRTEVSLRLPLDGDSKRTDTALALKGLLLYEHYGNWKFQGGGDRLLDYSRMLEMVADEVIRQLSVPIDSNWDPVVAAAELLVLGARLHGLPPSSRTTQEDKLDALYGEWAIPTEGMCSQEWKTLSNVFCDSQEALREILESHVLCAKGRTTTTKILDSARFEHVLRKSNLVPAFPPPENLPRRFGVLKVLHRAVADSLPAALLAEKQLWTDWGQSIERCFGDESLENVREAVHRAKEKLDDLGFQRLSREQLNRFSARSRALREADFIQLRPTVARISTAGTDSPVQQSALARDIGYAVASGAAAQRFLEYCNLVEEMFDSAERFIADQREDIESGDELESILNSLSETLTSIVEELLPPEPAVMSTANIVIDAQLEQDKGR